VARSKDGAMSENKQNGAGGPPLLSRRQTLPALAGILGAGVAGLRVARGEETASGDASNGTREYNVRAYGAKGDGQTLDTAAIQSAIDACTGDGGGTVVVPAGTFLTGTVEIKSNVTLRIAASGTILGSGRGSDYHAVDAIPLSGDATLADGNWALLFAVNAKNVAIEGPGTIDGQGAQFYSAAKNVAPPSGLGENRRPYHVLVYRCEGFSVRNITLLESAYHSLRVIESQRVHMDSIYIHNRVNINNDGFHFISAEYVTVSNCIVKCEDDACAMFGSCKYITITNCCFSTRWSVFRFGGGQADNVVVSNCLLSRVDGCPIKFQGEPGTRFENMLFSNLMLQEVTGPISISIGGQMSPYSISPAGQRSSDPHAPAVVRNISFSNIHGTVTSKARPMLESTVKTGREIAPYSGEAKACIVLNAVSDAILEDISFADVHLTFGGGGTSEDAARRNLPEISGEYFELGTLPAYALYARKVRGLTLDNVRFQVSTPDLRPAVILDRVEDVAVNGMSVQGNPEAESVLRFIDSRDALVTAVRVLKPSATFLQVEGTDSNGIIIDGGDLSNARTPVAFRNGATEKAVELRRISRQEQA
jgi:polygalacturonase